MGSSFSSLRQRAPSTKNTTPTLTSREVHEPATTDFTKKDDDLLTIELGKNDYDWLLTPPGTPLINSFDHKTASNNDDILSQAASFSSVQTLAAIKTSRFSSTKIEVNAKKEGETLFKKPNLVLRTGQNGLRSNGCDDGTLSGRSRSLFQPASPTKRPNSYAHVSHPTTPTNRTKPSLAPRSHPTTPTNKMKSSSASGSHPATPTSRPTSGFSFRSGSSSLPSSSSMTRKPVASSPVTPPARRLSGCQTQSYPLSAGVSSMSSVSKGRPLSSRSLPTSRGSSPTAANQAMLTSEYYLEVESPRTTFSKHLTKAEMALLTPRSIISRRSPVGSFLKGEGTASAQASVLSSNQSETSHEMIRKTCYNSFILAGNNAVQTGKSQDMIPSSTKDAVKGESSRRIIGTSLYPDTTWSALQAKHLLAKSAPPTSSRDNGGSSKRTPRRSLGYASHLQNLHQGTSNTGVPSSPFWSLLNSRHADAQVVPSTYFDAVSTSSNARVDDTTILSFEGGNSREDEFHGGLSFRGSPRSRSDHRASLFKDGHTNNQLGSHRYTDNKLGSHQYTDEGSDLMRVFEQGVNKFESCESPLVCPHGGGAAKCDICNVKMRLQMLNEKSKASFGVNAQILGEA